MTVHVVDSYAVLELDRLLLPGPTRATAFAELTKAVEDGSLVFPDAVVNECRDLCLDEQSAVWLVAVAGSRSGYKFPGKMPLEVLGKCPDLHADEDPNEQPQIEVACLAYHRQSLDDTVLVVTEDVGLGGDRIKLQEACAELGLEYCGIRQLLVALGLEHCCVAA